MELGFVSFCFWAVQLWKKARRWFGDHVRQACEGLNEKREGKLDSRKVNGGLGR